jgi:hypothetical protein
MADVVKMPLVPPDSWEAHALDLVRQHRIRAEEAGEIAKRPVKAPLDFPKSPQQLRLPFDTLTVYIKPK